MGSFVTKLITSKSKEEEEDDVIQFDPCFKNLPFDVIKYGILPYVPKELNQVNKALNTIAFKPMFEKRIELIVESCNQFRQMGYNEYLIKPSALEDMRSTMKLIIYAATTQNDKLFYQIIANKHMVKFLELKQGAITPRDGPYNGLIHEMFYSVALIGKNNMVLYIMPLVDTDLRYRMLLLYTVSSHFNINVFIELFRLYYAALNFDAVKLSLRSLLLIFGDLTFDCGTEEGIRLTNRRQVYIPLRRMPYDITMFRLVHEESHIEYQVYHDKANACDIMVNMMSEAAACFDRLYYWIEYLKHVAVDLNKSNLPYEPSNGKEILEFLNDVRDAIGVKDEKRNFERLMKLLRLRREYCEKYGENEYIQ